MRLGDHRLTLLLFALNIAIFLVMGQFFPQDLAIPLPGSDIRPVLLLEFASTPEHLVHIFGEEGDPLRAKRIAGMTTGNALDYVFMPLYGLFTLSFFYGVSRQTGALFWKFFGWMGIVAAASDAIENWLMFRMVEAFSAGREFTLEMSILPLPVWIKFGLLALSCAGAVWAFVILRRYPLAVLSLPAPVLLMPAIFDPFGIAPLATTTIALGWLAMAVHAGSSWRRSGPLPEASQSKL